MNSHLFAIVDDEDYESLVQHEWHPLISKKNRTVYAQRVEYIDGRKRWVLMHRQLLGLKYKDGICCDHVDGNGVLNVRSNLRIATRSQNSHNRRKCRTMRGVPPSSPYMGVAQPTSGIGWQLQVDGYHVGIYYDPYVAALTYDYLIKRVRGKFAALNFPGREIGQGRLEWLRAMDAHNLEELRFMAGKRGHAYNKGTRWYGTFRVDKTHKAEYLGGFDSKEEALQAIHERKLVWALHNISAPGYLRRG